MSMVQEKMYMDVDDVCAILGVSKTYACNYDMDSKRNGEELVQIFVDADACPVVGIVEKIAKEYNVSVMLLCDG